MFRQILVVVDGSESSQRAVDTAIENALCHFEGTT
jgi:nucleotide-binding universal stress UspA family protein